MNHVRLSLIASAAALLAANINGSKFDHIEKEAFTSLSPVDDTKFDLIGKITSTDDGGVILTSVNNSLCFDPGKDMNVVALVLEDKQSGQIIMQHMMNNFDDMTLQTKQVTFTPLQNGAFAVTAEVADDSMIENAVIYSDGTKLKLTDFEDMPMTLKEPIGTSIDMVICTQNFKPVNTFAAVPEKSQTASAWSSGKMFLGDK